MSQKWDIALSELALVNMYSHTSNFEQYRPEWTRLQSATRRVLGTKLEKLLFTQLVPKNEAFPRCASQANNRPWSRKQDGSASHYCSLQ